MERFFEKPEGVREERFFGFDWEFCLTDKKAFPEEGEAWRPVQLPHDWSTDYPVEKNAPSCGSGGYARCGIGWYRKHFSVSRKEGDVYTLRFDGVYMHCDVWLNGKHAGGHIYGYTSFELDVTGLLRNGKNELLIRVDNSHQPGSRWYTGSGITRNVYLRRSEELRVRTWSIAVQALKITDEKALLKVQADVIGPAGGEGFRAENVRAEAEIYDPWNRSQVRAEQLLPEGTGTAEWMLEVSAPARWDLDTPRLYKAVVRVYRGEKLADQTKTRFGIREIRFDRDQGFLLNGRKVILQGVCLHHDGGCVGAAVPPEIWQRRLTALKEMGCNALRMSHNPPDPALLDLADEMGFCVMDEAFDEWHTMKGKEFGSNTHESKGYSEWFDTCARADMTAMVERDRNHPSIVMWSIGNEVREQVEPDGWRTARMLAGLCHSLDPSRPITQACDMVKAEPVPAYTEFLNELDIVGVNYTDRWRERTETFFDEEKREHPDWLLLGTEDIAVNGARGDYRLDVPDSVWGRSPYYAKSLKAEKLWKYVRTRPFVIGSFMWTGVDYLGECFWPDKGAGAGVLDTCGYPKDGYYFYQSIWRKDVPVLHVFPHLNLPLEKGRIYPVLAYTNCFSAELFADGVSYGIKAYEFPNQGMTRDWAHFDRPFAPITTNDLHLSWDVPAGAREILVIGRDAEGKEVARRTLRPTGKPESLQIRTSGGSVPADGRSVILAEIRLTDEMEEVVPDQDLPVTVTAEGGELLGLDNGNTRDQTMYRSGTRNTFGGLLFAVIRAPREKGVIRLKVQAEGITGCEAEIRVES